MAQQKKMISCGAGLAALGMALRFVAGPLATLVGAAAFGLRGNVLRFAIIQVCVPYVDVMLPCTPLHLNSETPVQTGR